MTYSKPRDIEVMKRRRNDKWRIRAIKTAKAIRDQTQKTQKATGGERNDVAAGERIYTAKDIPIGSEAERQRLLAHQRRLNNELNDDYPTWDKPTSDQWDRGRRWMDIVRKQIHALRNPHVKRVQERFFQNVPICDSGSIYVDCKCISLASAILGRRAYEAQNA